MSRTFLIAATAILAVALIGFACWSGWNILKRQDLELKTLGPHVEDARGKMEDDFRALARLQLEFASKDDWLTESSNPRSRLVETLNALLTHPLKQEADFGEVDRLMATSSNALALEISARLLRSPNAPIPGNIRALQEAGRRFSRLRADYGAIAHRRNHILKHPLRRPLVALSSVQPEAPSPEFAADKLLNEQQPASRQSSD